MSENKSSSSPPLKSSHTIHFAAILQQLGISLAVSTHQAGKVILLREQNGSINTHSRNFAKPMGIATDGPRLTISGAKTVWHYRNVPSVAQKLALQGMHDAVYLPQHIQVTDDIDAHELAWGKDELWLVNTRFSTLSTLDEQGLSPRWRPNFITELAPEDRCHLNGLCMMGGQPKFVTALGTTNTAGGWRENKANGGVLIDVGSQEIIARGLSLPHSPRIHQGKLWVLESGKGALSTVDSVTGSWQTVATLPGFTRGISFVGSIAFIGISRIRESSAFSDIPIVEWLGTNSRQCGVWVVNIQTGQTLAFLRFDSGVQEIFAVEILPARYPELLLFDDERLHHSCVLPDRALKEAPTGLRRRALSA